MKQFVLLIVMVVLPAQAITWTTAAALTTITINVLDIKDNISKTVKAAHATKRAVKKTAKTLGRTMKKVEEKVNGSR